MKKSALNRPLPVSAIFTFFFPGNCFTQPPAVNSVRNIPESNNLDYQHYEFSDESGKPTGFNINLSNPVAAVTGLAADMCKAILMVGNAFREKLIGGGKDV